MSWPWNTVTDQEHITEELLEALLGVWDYMKNSEQATTNAAHRSTWALNWFGKNR